MNKIKLEERFEKAINAFFENENSNEQNSIVSFENQEITQFSPAENLAQTADKYFTLFKRIFAFLPGVLFLHLLMPGIFTFGFSIWTLFFLVSGIFMVWAGLGDLKNKKHIWLPISVMLVGLIFFVTFLFPACKLLYLLRLCLHRNFAFAIYRTDFNQKLAGN